MVTQPRNQARCDADNTKGVGQSPLSLNQALGSVTDRDASDPFCRSSIPISPPAHIRQTKKPKHAGVTRHALGHRLLRPPRVNQLPLASVPRRVERLRRPVPSLTVLVRISWPLEPPASSSAPSSAKSPTPVGPVRRAAPGSPSLTPFAPFAPFASFVSFAFLASFASLASFAPTAPFASVASFASDPFLLPALPGKRTNARRRVQRAH